MFAKNTNSQNSQKENLSGEKREENGQLYILAIPTSYSTADIKGRLIRIRGEKREEEEDKRRNSPQERDTWYVQESVGRKK